MIGDVEAYVKIKARVMVDERTPRPRATELFDGLVGATLLNDPERWGEVTGIEVVSGSIGWRPEAVPDAR